MAPDTPSSPLRGEAPTLSPKSQRRWALGGCFGCLGFLVLAAGLSLLGVKRALDPGNVWAQLSAYMGFELEAPPAGYRPLFVLPFFDQRQIAFYRTSDQTQVLLQEYSGRTREDFDLAFDVAALEALPGIAGVQAERLSLQGREIEVVRFVGAEQLEPAPEARGGLRGWLVETFDLRPVDLPEFRRDTPVVRIRFSGDADFGGTVVNVRAPTQTPLTEDDLEALFAPFDLWSRVGSAPVFVDPDAGDPAGS